MGGFSSGGFSKANPGGSAAAAFSPLDPGVCVLPQLAGQTEAPGAGAGLLWTFVVPCAVTVGHLSADISNTTGNVCLAVYDSTGATRILTTGTVAAGAGNQTKYACTGSATLQPGSYLFYAGTSSGSGAFNCTASQMLVRDTVASFPAPASVTPPATAGHFAPPVIGLSG